MIEATIQSRRRSAPKAKEKAASHSAFCLPASVGEVASHILVAAQRVFEAKGLDGANMRAIAKEAGYTPGAI